MLQCIANDGSSHIQKLFTVVAVAIEGAAGEDIAGDQHIRAVLDRQGITETAFIEQGVANRDPVPLGAEEGRARGEGEIGRVERPNAESLAREFHDHTIQSEAQIVGGSPWIARANIEVEAPGEASVTAYGAGVAAFEHNILECEVIDLVLGVECRLPCLQNVP